MYDWILWPPVTLQYPPLCYFSVIGLLRTIPFCKGELRVISIFFHIQERTHLATVLIHHSSPSPTVSQSIPSSFPQQQTGDDSAPHRPALARQGFLCPSLPMQGKRFLWRLQRTRQILLQAMPEKEKSTVTRYEWNPICWIGLAAMTILHADRSEWKECSESWRTWQTYRDQVGKWVERVHRSPKCSS